MRSPRRFDRLVRRLGAALILSLAAAAPLSAGELVLDEVAVPTTAADKATWRATAGATLDGQRLALGFRPLLATGRTYGAGTFGQIVDVARKPIREADGTPLVSHYADFSSLIAVRDQIFAVTHFESLPSALYLTRLARDRASGSLSAVETRPLSLAFIGGIYNPCAGVVTPWGTHLGGEEYPPDVRAFEVAAREGKAQQLTGWVKNALRYFAVDAAKDGFATIQARFKPYRYGWPFEVRVRAFRDVSIVRHHAMGRFSHELAFVMPDRRTVYLTDDGDNVGFFMFVADRAGDLSAGRLYAMTFTQTAPDGSKDVAGDLTWVDLGHARSATIAAAIEQGVTFASLFETAEPGQDGACPAGFGSVNFVGDTDGRKSAGECLKVRPGREALASRLETRRFAALKGATTELSKAEGLTFDAGRRQIYMSLATIERGMESRRNRGKADTDFDRGGPNHIRLAHNPCGAVVAVTLAPDQKIGSDFVARSMRPLLTGTPDGTAQGNSCALGGIAGPDNLTFIPEHDTLIIAEDSSGRHENDAIWAYDVGRDRLRRIMTMPLGAEASGTYWYSDLGGAGWLTAVVQHPLAADQGTAGQGAPAEGGTKAVRLGPATIGLIGPFPPPKR